MNKTSAGIDTPTIAVGFEGPFSLASRPHRLLFGEPIARDPGIYLWTIPYCEGGYLVSYVGETGVSFGHRLKDHVIQTMGGNYRICDPALLAQGQAKVLWNGLWRKGTRDKVPEYLEQAEGLAAYARRELQLTAIFVAPVRFATPRLRRRVEGALAHHIKKQQHPASSLLPGDIRYYRRWPSEPPVRVDVSCPERVYGLPRFLEA